MMRILAFLPLLSSLLSLLVLALAPPGTAEAEPAFPGKSWDRYGSPEDAGFSSAKLAAVREASEELDTAAVMIVHRGKVVDAWGDLESNLRCHSLRKSFLSALYGIQVDQGKINLDATMEHLGIDDNEGLSEVEKQATVRQLLQARSGVYHPALYETEAMARRRPERHAHAPGEFYYYNNWDFNALGTIYEQETRETIFASFGKRIARPIGMEDYTPENGRYSTGEASRHAAYPFTMSARDLARFGLLFLNRGSWNGKRIVPESWVEESTTSYSDAGHSGYGYMWWVAPDGRQFPERSFSGRGHRGQVLTVVPAHDLVFVHRVDSSVEGTSVSYDEIADLLAGVLAAKE